jgi:hypothetical protein
LGQWCFVRSLRLGYVLALSLLDFLLARPGDSQGQFRGNNMPGPPPILPANLGIGGGAIAFGGLGGFPAFGFNGFAFPNFPVLGVPVAGFPAFGFGGFNGFGGFGGFGGFNGFAAFPGFGFPMSLP